jgi:hypothetical protein
MAPPWCSVLSNTRWDFTRCFEERVLRPAPLVLVVVAALAQIRSLSRAPALPRTRRSLGLLSAKLVRPLAARRVSRHRSRAAGPARVRAPVQCRRHCVRALRRRFARGRARAARAALRARAHVPRPHAHAHRRRAAPPLLAHARARHRRLDAHAHPRRTLADRQSTARAGVRRDRLRAARVRARVLRPRVVRRARHRGRPPGESARDCELVRYVRRTRPAHAREPDASPQMELRVDDADDA